MGGRQGNSDDALFKLRVNICDLDTGWQTDGRGIITDGMSYPQIRR